MSVVVTFPVRAAELRHQARAPAAAADPRVAAGAAQTADHGAWGQGQLRATAQAEGGAQTGAGEGRQDHGSLDLHRRN
ncbi:hypothetical protein CEXT_798871 [Caerostris extrusa]|uniref:Uncharacterized protein n=1 Tax=Caerostris extrusa TaxID=172846 RepID=A0AAV4NAU2_CAEEX|nr:hypothetical protein CEXT_798871 [Caerostris extrusa]